MFEETLQLVQTVDDVSLLRQELEALRQSLYRVGKGDGGDIEDIINHKSYSINHFERVLETEVRAVAAEAIRADLKESRASRAGRTGRTSREGREHSGSETQIESKERSFTPGVEKATYSRSRLEEFLDELEETLLKLRLVHLTLAFEPTRDMIGNIANIINKKSYTGVTGGVKGAAGLVLKLEVEPSILGGIQLTTADGRFYDLSVGGKIDGILQESKTEILQHLKRKVEIAKKVS